MSKLGNGILRLRRIAIWTIALALCASAAVADQHKVLVFTSDNGDIYETVAKTLADTIHDADSSGIELSLFDPNNIAPSESLAKHISSYDLIVTIGTKATDTLHSLQEHPPAIATLVPKQHAKSLLQDTQQRSGLWTSAIILDQPIERQLNLIKLITKGALSIGLLMSPASGYAKGDIEALSRRVGVSIFSEVISPDENVIRELGFILDKADVLLAIPDPVIFNRQTAGSVLQSAYRRRIPVIGYSLTHVKAGAMAAVYSSPEQIGRHTGESVLEYFAKNGRDIPVLQGPKYFSVAFNRQVERSLGFSLPAERDVEIQIHSLENSSLGSLR